MKKILKVILPKMRVGNKKYNFEQIEKKLIVLNEQMLLNKEVVCLFYIFDLLMTFTDFADVFYSMQHETYIKPLNGLHDFKFINLIAIEEEVEYKKNLYRRFEKKRKTLSPEEILYLNNMCVPVPMPNISILNLPFKNLEHVPKPVNWLKFLTAHFSSLGKTEQNIQKLINYLLLQYNILFKQTPFILSDYKNNFVLCYSLNENFNDYYFMMGGLRADSSPEDLESFNCLNIYYLKGDPESYLEKTVLKSFIFPKDKKFNVVLLLNCKQEQIDFFYENLLLMSFRILIDSFYKCELLFMPGENVDFEVTSKSLEMKHLDKLMLYQKIVSKEFLSIVVYILKSSNRKI